MNGRGVRDGLVVGALVELGVAQEHEDARLETALSALADAAMCPTFGAVGFGAVVGGVVGFGAGGWADSRPR